MIDEKQADAPATGDVADAEVPTDEQVWSKITGQDQDETSSDEAEVDSQDDAATDDAATDTAQAVSDDDADGSGDTPGEQDSEGATREKRLKGQISGQARKIAELQRKIAGYADTKDSGESRTPNDLSELADEYPDIVGPLLASQTEMQERMDAMSAQLSSMAELQGAQIDATEEVESARLEQDHPDWFDYLQQHGDEFTAWVDDQPAAIRATIASNLERVVDGSGVSSVITAFKAHRAGESPDQSAPKGADLNTGMTSRRKRQLDGARTIQSRGTQAATTELRPDESDAEAIWEKITN